MVLWCQKCLSIKSNHYFEQKVSFSCKEQDKVESTFSISPCTSPSSPALRSLTDLVVKRQCWMSGVVMGGENRVTKFVKVRTLRQVLNLTCWSVWVSAMSRNEKGEKPTDKQKTIYRQRRCCAGLSTCCEKHPLSQECAFEDARLNDNNQTCR